MSNALKSDSVWAVRGIPDDLRRAVVVRAKAEGRTVGAWVSDALRRALDGDAIAEQVAELRRRIEALEGRAR
ncbi:MAG: hypothetical protein NVV74_03890 [Magnetospirillum sp.]|nr:hypothetical protein [Magnetospirillum sp.]